MNQIIIALGSNELPELHMEEATAELNNLFSSIHWSPAVYTEPIACLRPFPFLNRVAIAETSLDVEELHNVFKVLEKKLGRLSTSKQTGIIPIDIDLIQWNQQLLKPNDYDRVYVQEALRWLAVSMG